MRRPNLPINRSRTFWLIECHEVVWFGRGTVGGFFEAEERERSMDRSDATLEPSDLSHDAALKC